MNKYTELKKRHQQEVDAFPMVWAYSKEQLTDGMKKLGVESEEELCFLGAGLGGGIIKKTDKQRFLDMLRSHRKERADAIADDKTGDGFIYDMFLAELNAHEYGYTCDYEDTLDALGYSYEDLENDPRLKHGIEKAAAKIGDGGGF